MGTMGPRRNNPKGLTLIELLIVVAIIGVLSVIVLYNFALAADRARQVECASRLKTIGYALYAYRLDNNTYPLADGVAGDKPTPFETDFGNGPAGNGFWDGISLLLVECGYIEDPNILYCPALAKRYPYRRPNLRYAYNCGTADTGGYQGGDNNIFRDSHDIWLVRCLRVDPDEYKRDRRRPIPFPHGLDRSMENVLFSNGRVEIVPGGMSTP
jgi:prepilin-type N-terminal cleavage/methylation domain-containing protein